MVRKFGIFDIKRYGLSLFLMGLLEYLPPVYGVPVDMFSHGYRWRAGHYTGHMPYPPKNISDVSGMYSVRSTRFPGSETRTSRMRQPTSLLALG